ncbi:MAG: VOC family protein [Acidimicrobiia bacterium]
MASINPYLNFSGNCEEAFEFYKSVLGGEIDIQHFSDVPADVPVPEPEGDKVMHVVLPMADGQVLMGSDRPATMGPTTPGDNVQINITPDSAGEARRIFEGLAEGGRITMPYEQAFWGAEFGMLTDKFGINWMVNYDSQAV